MTATPPARDPAVITTILQSWCDRLLELESRVAELLRVLGVAPACPLLNAVAAVADGYTAATAARVGDAREWLDWYWHECDLGAAPKEVTVAGRAYAIATVADLANIICMEI